MKKVFEKANVGGIVSKNRVVRSATQEGLALDDGKIGKELISVYEKLSKGGVGIIITSMVGTDEKSRVFPLMIKGYDESYVKGMSEIVKNAHANDCRIVVQIAHNGAKAKPDDGSIPLGPSKMTLGENEIGKLSVEEIGKLKEDFAKVALASKEAGADGIQIHGAHGYLLSQFLSPIFNKRTDKYGGNIENRARIIFEIYDAIRDSVGEDYPIWIKINSADFLEGGLSFEESQWVCQELDERGINGIEVSGGIALSAESVPARNKIDKDEGSFSEYTQIISNNVKTSVISVGGYREPATIESWLNKGNIDAISLSRPLVCEPDLINTWANGDERVAKCISCNKCFDYSTGFGCKVFN